jgi:hypothetical protein
VCVCVCLAALSCQSLIPRWTFSLSMSEEQIHTRFLFLPRLPHPAYLQLLSYSAVFLNTFPFGSGITSSEALAMCVPVLVLPELVSVLQIAYAQVSCYVTVVMCAICRLIDWSFDSAVILSLLLLKCRLLCVMCWVTMKVSQLGDEFSDLLVVHNVDDYVERAVQLASLSPEEAFRVRRRVCGEKHRLFGKELLTRVVDDWRQVLISLKDKLI